MIGDNDSGGDSTDDDDGGSYDNGGSGSRAGNADGGDDGNSSVKNTGESCSTVSKVCLDDHVVVEKKKS